MSGKKSNNKNAIKVLQSSKKEILSYLQEVVKNGSFNYRTFGTAIEEHLNDILIKIFTEKEFIKNKEDYTVAPNKNHFPDFELKATKSIAIEFKTGNKSQNRNGKWATVKNSENDMGTLNEWPNKIAKYGGENIFYIFVLYNFNDEVEEILDVEIEPFYKFLGVIKAGVLKYREKDGNLRPKDFEAKPPIKTLEKFQQLLDKTVVYRSKRIIKKHRLIINNFKKAKKE